jgi:biotin carboxyl carrier protein
MVYALIPGVVDSIAVQAGDAVAVGQVLCALEAMKMKNAIRASRAGQIARLHVVVGQHVRHNDPLVE